MNMRNDAMRSRKGFVLVYYTLILLVLIPLVGLAVDLGTLYNIKLKLGAAVDAAALAGGRCLNRGMSFTEAKPAAEAAARRWFAANFPAGYWGATLAAGDPTIDVVQTAGNKTLQVTVSASPTAPLYFLRVLGAGNTTTVGNTAVALRRYLNVILVLDRSGSILSAGADQAVRDSSTNFVNQLNEGQDQVGLISFSGYIAKHFSPTSTFKAGAATAIKGLTFAGGTNSATGLQAAYDMLRTLNDPIALNVIVFFTDGRPSALSGKFQVKTQQDTRRGWNSSGFSYSNEYKYGATGKTPLGSPCTLQTQLRGFVTTYVNNGWPPPTKGYTWGVMGDNYADTGQTVTNDATASSDKAACFFSGNNTKLYYTSSQTAQVSDIDAGNGFSGLFFAMRADVAYIPPTDIGNNSTSGYMTPETFPNTSAYQYPIQIRPDSPLAVRYASYNAFDNCAQKIHKDATLRPLIYTIGLGGSGAEGIDATLLQRVANDPNSPIYDKTLPTGKFVLASDKTQLQGAFNTIVSQILRLAQ